MKRSAYLIILVYFLSGCSNEFSRDILHFVNPFIGTDGHGHTFPGAATPFGMVQLSPDTRKDNWDACSGYHYSDSFILGFSHTHLSGTGVGDYGDIRFMPMTGTLRTRPGNEKEPGYRSAFSHQNEKASPGYYQVYLEDHRIDAEFTVTPRCGLHQYTFPASDESFILIDLTESVMTEKNPGLSATIISDHEICGYRRSSGWAEDQVVYFYSVFSRPFDEAGILLDGIVSDEVRIAEGNDIQIFVKYSTRDREKILVKTGISAVSIDGARNNVEHELPGWDFGMVKQHAEQLWREKLSKIEVEGGNKDDIVKFYTALYHCYLAPNLFSDPDGRYRGHDGLIHQAEGFDVYTVFSLWDTYRALHPLLTILEPGLTVDFIKTFLDIYEKGGLLPVWELAGNETNCMIGYHAVPVIADAYIKGIKSFDIEKAYAAMRTSAEQDHFGLKYYKEYGYIPAEAEGEAVSKTLEYSYDDWCIAMMAKDLGKNDDHRYFMERAQNYKNLYEPQTGFLRGKRNGMFAEPFDPAEVNFMLTEANTWQYTFYVPQDIEGLKNLMGGDEAFEKKLDEMFTTESGLSGRQQADITGLIGQYAHGNEPSHHMAYLYNYVGRPDKTQKLARQIMDQLYGPGADGLCGNEDCGQMSAWFVFSAMGFYPVTPATVDYVIGSPLFNKITIHQDNGKSFSIISEKNSSRNIFIQSARLDDKPYERSFITHNQIINGGNLEFNMGPEPSGEWGNSAENRPNTAINDHLITPVPYFQAASGSFQENLDIQLLHIDPGASIYINNDEKGPQQPFEIYREPIHTDQSLTVHAFAELDPSGRSKLAKASFYKIHNDWTITILNPYSSQYTGGGDLGLIDGQHGGPNFRTGSWQGYQGVDFEATIDMAKEVRLGDITASFLQDQRSWIFMPVEVEFFLSSDGTNYRSIGKVMNDAPDNLPDAVIEEFSIDGSGKSARFVKVHAINRGVCPEWHVGAGDKAWIFIDEITIGTK